MKLSVITDEIDDDLERALDLCEELGIDAVELRSVGGRNVTEQPVEELHSMDATLRRRGFTVCAIGSPFLKCHRNTRGLRTGTVHGATTRTREEQPAVLTEAIRAAGILSAPLVRAFSYWREPAPLAVVDELATELRDASARAIAAGVTLALENEHECNVASRGELVAVLAETPADLGVIWDAANEAKLDPAAPAAHHDLRAFRERIVHVHIKDVDRQGNWAPVGAGIVDQAALLAELQSAAYAGYLSLEPHYARDGSRAEATRECVASLRAIAASALIDLPAR